MKKLLLKIYRWVNPLYQVVYTTQDGRTEMYTITEPQYKNEFGNIKEGKKVVGLEAFVSIEMAFALFATIESQP